MGRSLSFRTVSSRIVWVMDKLLGPHAKTARTSRSLCRFARTAAERALPDRRCRFVSMEGPGRVVAGGLRSNQQYRERRRLYCVRISPAHQFDDSVGSYAPNPFQGARAGLPLRNWRCPPSAVGHHAGHRFWRLLRVSVGVAHVRRTAPLSPRTGTLIGLRVKSEIRDATPSV